MHDNLDQFSYMNREHILQLEKLELLEHIHGNIKEHFKEWITPRTLMPIPIPIWPLS
jgi:hypothetical protein